MLTAEAELWAEVSGGGVEILGRESGSEEEFSGLFGSGDFAPTIDMIIIIASIIFLIIMCCLIRACYNWCESCCNPNKVTDADVELAKI